MAFGVPATVATGVGLLFALGVGRGLAESWGQGYLLDFLAEEVLDGLEAVDVGIADEGDGGAVAIGAGRTSDAVDVVFGIMGHVVVDDGEDIVDVDASGHSGTSPRRAPVARGRSASGRN